MLQGAFTKVVRTKIQKLLLFLQFHDPLSGPRSSVDILGFFLISFFSSVFANVGDVDDDSSTIFLHLHLSTLPVQPLSGPIFYVAMPVFSIGFPVFLDYSTISAGYIWLLYLILPQYSSIYICQPLPCSCHLSVDSYNLQ